MRLTFTQSLHLTQRPNSSNIFIQMCAWDTPTTCVVSSTSKQNKQNGKNMARRLLVHFVDGKLEEVTPHQFNVVTLHRRKFNSRSELERVAKLQSATSVVVALMDQQRRKREDEYGSRQGVSIHAV
jgi:hypothetical protein